MRVHYIQHVEFEDPAGMLDYFKNKKFQVNSTKLFLGEKLPLLKDFDFLVIMGGPMGVSDEEKYTWLKDEKKFIKDAINSGKKMIGICLGAQLIAEVMGATVSKNRYREIGWFPVKKSPLLQESFFDSVLPSEFNAFHWHGDTFAIPEGAIPIGSSEACENQGFIYDERVAALQFHLETTYESAAALIKNCGHELDGSRYVQSGEDILSHEEKFSSIMKIMDRILDSMT